MVGKIHSIETFGSVDGPGIRFIAFFQGCNLRCKYCHNVDTWTLDREGMETMTADEILDRAERYRSYWGKPEVNAFGEIEVGGLTVSGGEPLVQIDFLIELFEKAKKRDINTCIDTAGEPFTREGEWFEKFQKLMEYTDLLMVDIKHIDREKHIDLTGKPNDNIIDMFHYLDEIGKPIWIRHVLVPGITDDDNYLNQTADFIRTLSNVRRVDVLPYHKLALHKWKALGIPYALEGTEPPTQDRVDNARRILEAAVPTPKN